MKTGNVVSKFRIILVTAVLTLLFAPQMISAKGVKRYRVRVVEIFPHDIGSYTQGLFFHNGSLFESTGQKGESSFREVDLKSGKSLKIINFPYEYFVEGSVILNDKIYILTWENRVCFVYDRLTMKPLKNFFNQREGWGLTTDGVNLIMSDGSSSLFVKNPDNFADISEIKVTMDGKPIDYLNELEYINGEIWANVYLTDNIVIINPKTGIVRAVVDCKGLLPQSLRSSKTDVLNGIAYDVKSGKIYLTGKYWPKLYSIKLIE